MADQVLSPAANSSVVVPPNNDIAYLSPDLTILIKAGASGVTYDSSMPNAQTFTWTLLYDHATPIGGAVTPTANGFTISAGTATFSLSDAENPNVPLGFLALDTAGPPVTITEIPSPGGMGMNALKVTFSDPQAAVGTVGFASSAASASAMPDLIGHIG